MTRLATVAALLSYAGRLGVVAPAPLRRARWVTRAPNLAIGLWQALSVSWLVCAVLVGLALIGPALLAGGLARPSIVGAAGGAWPSSGRRSRHNRCGTRRGGAFAGRPHARPPAARGAP